MAAAIVDRPDASRSTVHAASSLALRIAYLDYGLTLNDQA